MKNGKILNGLRAVFRLASPLFAERIKIVKEESKVIG